MDLAEIHGMNTLDARHRLMELTNQAFSIVERLASGGAVTSQDRSAMREILQEAREVAYDAGHPGDAAWRSLLHASVYVTAPPGEVTDEFWSEVLENLSFGRETLALVTEAAAEK